MNPFKFSQSILFIPLSIIFLFVPQSIIGLFYLDVHEALKVAEIFLIGIFFYFLAYFFIKRIFHDIKNNSNIFFISSNLNLITVLSLITFVLYCLLVTYIIYKAPSIPVLEAINGATSFEIAKSRELFLHLEDGTDKYIIYIFAMFTSALIPYFLMALFLLGNKLAWIMYAIFYASLLISMEKALLMKAFIPLFLIAANGYLSKKILYISPLIAIFFIVSMSFLAKGSDNGASQGVIMQSIYSMSLEDRNARLGLVQRGVPLALEKHVEKYFPLRGTSSIGNLANRILWIPYITAYDWIEYFDNEMDGTYAKGNTSSFVSKLAGAERIPMEQMVFNYQFGLGDAKTAGANANFIIDAYVNFGIIGVAMISAFVAIAIFFVQSLNNPAASACLYFFLFQLVGGGFLGVFLGGGFSLFLLLSYLVRPNFVIKKA